MSAAWKYLFADVQGYYYDSRSSRYIDADTGRFVSRSQVLGLMEERIAHHQRNMTDLTEAMVEGRLALADWQRLFKGELKLLHVQQAVLSRGGWERMTPSDWGRVGQAIREQYRFLAGFAEDIANGTFKSGRIMSNGMILGRAAMYAQSGRATYWKEQSVVQSIAGMTQERRIAVGDDRTCGPCQELAAAGWQPIGSLPAPGGPPCDGLTLCRCEKEYRRT